MGNLYVVATPIGNIEDITFRAITTLFSSDVIVSENTSHTLNLLSLIETRFKNFIPSNKKKPKIINMNEFEEEYKIPRIISILQEGNNVSLISSAGTPLISDPGFKLIKRAVEYQIPVIPIPGASSVLASLSVSGLPTDKFLFIGFLPRTYGKKKNKLTDLKEVLENMEKKDYGPSVVLFESPRRIVETLQCMMEVFSDINIFLGRELTKKFEEVNFRRISFFLNKYSEIIPKGEYVVIFNLKIS